jgi:hypothetical protein
MLNPGALLVMQQERTMISPFTALPPTLQKEELARKAVSKSHRQRVEELNQLLATTPEHYDLFKISYAGIG